MKHNFVLIGMLGLLVIGSLGCANADAKASNLVSGTLVDEAGNIIESESEEAPIGEVSIEGQSKIVADKYVKLGLNTVSEDAIEYYKVLVPEDVHVLYFESLSKEGKIEKVKPRTELSKYSYPETTMPCSISFVTSDKQYEVTYRLYASDKDKLSVLDTIDSTAKDTWSMNGTADISSNGRFWSGEVCYEPALGFESYAITENSPGMYLIVHIKLRNNMDSGMDTNYMFSNLKEYLDKVEK